MVLFVCNDRNETHAKERVMCLQQKDTNSNAYTHWGSAQLDWFTVEYSNYYD